MKRFKAQNILVIGDLKLFLLVLATFDFWMI